jgi:hypothetical protein
MSTTDLLNGSYSSLPTYNVKNNPSIFNFNTVQKVNYVRQLLLAISFNRVFIDVVTDLKKWGEDYYNNDPKRFCSTVQLNPVVGYNNQNITVYLPSPGGMIDNSIEYVKVNYTTKTWLMRILAVQKLPTCWGHDIKSGFNGTVCQTIAVNPSQMSNNEKVLYYYIKNADFFTRTLQLLTNSFYIHSVQRFQCYTLVFPSDLYPGTKQDRTFVVTNDFLKSVYSQYLRLSRGVNPYKLPAPVTVASTPYTVPTTNLTQNELTQIINDNTDMFII